MDAQTVEFNGRSAKSKWAAWSRKKPPKGKRREVVSIEATKGLVIVQFKIVDAVLRKTKSEPTTCPACGAERKPKKEDRR